MYAITQSRAMSCGLGDALSAIAPDTCGCRAHLAWRCRRHRTHYGTSFPWLRDQLDEVEWDAEMRHRALTRGHANQGVLVSTRMARGCCKGFSSTATWSRGLSDNGTVVVVKELRGAVLTPLAVAMSLVSGNRRRACLR